MQDLPKSKLNTIFWRLRHDWVTFKTPISEGKVLTPHDYLAPGFEINSLEHWYIFEESRRDRRKMADFSGWNNGALFINERAYETYNAMLQQCGRIFPVRANDKRYYIVIIDTVIDAIDMKASVFVRAMDDGGPVEEDISKVKRIVLTRGFSTEADIFRIDRGFALRQEIIVSDKFKSLYEKSQLTGLIFSAATQSELAANS